MAAILSCLQSCCFQQCYDDGVLEAPKVVCFRSSSFRLRHKMYYNNLMQLLSYIIIAFSSYRLRLVVHIIMNKPNDRPQKTHWRNIIYSNRVKKYIIAYVFNNNLLRRDHFCCGIVFTWRISLAYTSRTAKPN